MRHHGLIYVMVGCGLVACGEDGSNAGSGSKTLLVDAQVSYEDGAARARITVKRAGVPVTDAVVKLDSKDGEVSLVHEKDGIYRGVQAGWRTSYGISVSAGPDGIDNLDGAIESPELAVLTKPAPGVPFDPRLAANSLIELSWSGERAMLIRVRTKDYNPDYVVDDGKVMISNTYFEESSQEIRLDRRNQIELRGGAPGSLLKANVESKTNVSVLNPF